MVDPNEAAAPHEAAVINEPTTTWKTPTQKTRRRFQKEVFFFGICFIFACGRYGKSGTKF